LKQIGQPKADKKFIPPWLRTATKQELTVTETNAKDHSPDSPRKNDGVAHQTNEMKMSVSVTDLSNMNIKPERSVTDVKGFESAVASESSMSPVSSADTGVISKVAAMTGLWGGKKEEEPEPTKEEEPEPPKKEEPASKVAGMTAMWGAKNEEMQASKAGVVKAKPESPPQAAEPEKPCSKVAGMTAMWGAKNEEMQASKGGAKPKAKSPKKQHSNGGGDPLGLTKQTSNKSKASEGTDPLGLTKPKKAKSPKKAAVTKKASLQGGALDANAANNDFFAHLAKMSG